MTIQLHFKAANWQETIEMRISLLLCMMLICFGCSEQGMLKWGRETGSAGKSGSDARNPGTTKDHSPRVLIVDPQPGKEIRRHRIAVSGRVASIPADNRLVVFLADDTNYFLQWPPARIDRSSGRFSHYNVRFGSTGRWTILAAIAPPRQARELERRVNSGNWRGMSTLPHGIKVIDSRIVDVRISENPKK